VFDGTLDRPYREDDRPNPINPYGASKLRGEQLVAEANERHLIVRTAWLFGPDGENFVTKIHAAAQRASAAQQPLRVVADEWGNPTDVGWLARSIAATVASPSGARLLHLAGTPAVSRLGWARAILSARRTRIEAAALANYPRASRVPPRAILDTASSAAWGVEEFDWRSSALWPVDAPRRLIGT
jgi:dTDP-4-dehydrorhamnose reductase